MTTEGLDRATLEEGLGRLRAELHRYVRTRVADDALAEDLVQETLLRLYEHAGELRDGQRLAPWARSIARNAIVDHARRLRPQVPLDEMDAPAAEADDGAPLDEVVAGWLRPMLELLPADHAEAVARADLAGEPMADIAAATGLSVSGAKSRVQRGRRMLAEALHACCELVVDRRGHVRDYRPRRDDCDC